MVILAAPTRLRVNIPIEQLFKLVRLDWDDGVLEIFGISRSMLPQICPSDSDFGETDFGGILKEKAPIRAVLGDSHAALFGQRCHKPGQLKVTYGTGSSVMMNTGTEIVRSSNGLAMMSYHHHARHN